MFPLISNIQKQQQKLDQDQQFQFLKQLTEQPQHYFQQIQTLLQNFDKQLLPNTFGELLVAIQTSTECFYIFKQTVTYFINIMMLFEFLSQIVSKSKNVLTISQISNSNQLITVDETIKQLDDEIITKWISSQDEIKNIDPNTLLFIYYLKQISNKQNMQLNKLKQVQYIKMNTTIKQNIQINFNNLNEVFKYDQVETYHILKYFVEREHLICKKTKLLIKLKYLNYLTGNVQYDQYLFKQLVNILFNENAFVTSVQQLQQANDIDFKLMVSTVIKNQFSNNKILVTSCQMLNLLLEYNDILFIYPSIVEYIIINNNLFFICHYKDINKYTVLKDYQMDTKTQISTNNNIFNTILSRMITIQKNYQSLTLRINSFIYIDINNIYVRNSLKNEVRFMCCVNTLHYKLIENQELQVINQSLLFSYFLLFTLVQLSIQYILINNNSIKQLLKYNMQLFYSQFFNNEEYLHASTLYSNDVRKMTNYLQISTKKEIQIFLTIVEQHNLMDQEILQTYSLINSGFLSLTHQTIQKICDGELSYLEFVQVDKQTTLLQMVRVANSFRFFDSKEQIKLSYTQNFKKQYQFDFKNCLIQLKQQIPKMESFMEEYMLEFDGNHNPSYINSFQQEFYMKFPQKCLIASIHELQYMVKSYHKLNIDSKMQYLAQVLVDMIYINPIQQQIQYQIQDQIAIDNSGVSKQIISELFDELINQQQIKSDDIKKMLLQNRYFDDKFDAQIINANIEHTHNILNAVEIDQQTILIPHYIGVRVVNQHNIFPRINDRSSCLYYLGKLLSYCFIYNIQIPNVFYDNFYKSLVKGKYYYKPENTDKQQNLLQLYRLNGSLTLQDQAFEIGEEECSLYFKHYQLLKYTITNDVDLQYICLSEQSLKYIKDFYKIDMSQRNNQILYSKTAIQELISGKAHMTLYQEFRNGFRHTFTYNQNILNKYQQQLVKMIDKCLELLDYEQLKEVLTFNQQQNSRQIQNNNSQLVQNLFQANFSRYQYDVDSVDIQCILNSIISVLSNKQLFPDSFLIQLVFAATGQRNIKHNNINVKFVQQEQNTKRLISFHTCNNQIQIPLKYVLNLIQNDETLKILANYIQECVNLALQNQMQLP